MSQEVLKFNKVTKYEMGNSTAHPEQVKFRRKILFQVSLTQPYGEIVGVIGGNGTEKKAIGSLLMREIRPDEGDIQGIRGLALKVSLNQLKHEVGTGEDYAKNFFSNFGYSGIALSQLLDVCSVYSQLGSLFFKDLNQYSMEEKTRLLLSVTLHVAPKLLYIDDCLMLVKESFFVKVIKSLNLLAQQGSSVWLMSTQAEKIATYCDTLIWLYFGQVRYYGESSVVLGYYHEHLHSLQQLSLTEQQEFWNQEEAKLIRKSAHKGMMEAQQTKKEIFSSRMKLLCRLVLVIGGYVLFFYILLSLFADGKITQRFPTLLSKEITSVTKKVNVKTKETSLVVTTIVGESVQSSEDKTTNSIEVAPFSHKVVAGETIGEIADYYGVDLNDLMKINHISDSTIYAGTFLSLPKGAIVHPIDE